MTNHIINDGEIFNTMDSDIAIIKEDVNNDINSSMLIKKIKFAPKFTTQTKDRSSTKPFEP